MAELNFFHYLPGQSIFHRMDGRIKLCCAVLLGITTAAAGRAGLTVLSLVFLAVLVKAALPLKKIAVELRYFLFLIVLIITVHSFSIPGAPLTNLPIPNPTWEGLRSGLLFGWRIIILVLISSILTATTTLSALKTAIEWYLRPWPLVPETKVATMIGLIFVLIPLLFEQASEMRDAQKARCVAGRKNPTARIVFLVYPLLLHTVMRADELAYAMESRCYSEERTPAVFQTKINDWAMLTFTGLVCGMAFYLR